MQGEKKVILASANVSFIALKWQMFSLVLIFSSVFLTDGF